MPASPTLSASSPHGSASSSESSRIKVTGLSANSTEASVREFFSFCGDIRLLHLYASAATPEEQEAVILFESDAGASTAVLLDNAVVDGSRIRVELFPETPTNSPRSGTGRRSPAPNTPKSTSDKASSKGMWSDIVSESQSMASETWRSAKGVDEKYQVSGKVKGAATTVVAATSSAAVAVDEKLHVRENAAAAWSATKSGVASLDAKLGVSSTVSGWFGWGKKTPENSNGSPRSSPKSFKEELNN